jgi:hypothetical protein
MFLGSCTEPDHESCEGDGSEVHGGALFVAGSNGAEALEPVDGMLDSVAFLVALTVECGGPSAMGASALPVPELVEATRGWCVGFHVVAGSGGCCGMCRPCPPGPGRAGFEAGRL